jgi:eukaryotic-like serine/threonine-protein kinase
MKCSKCHTENERDAASCSSCGSKFGPLDETTVLSRADLNDFTRSFVADASALSMAPGSDFGPRYQMLSLLGVGGMGRVYKAYDKDLDRVVAVKLLRPELAGDEGSVARFKQELLLASKISHKNILRIHDLGEVNGVKFISMAFIEGEDLCDLIQREGRLPLDRAVGIAKQLCRALEAAHTEKVVHRDLKPRNVLVGAGGQVYVSDFGLAKSIEPEATRMTQAGTILGTPRYMSPEQVQGKPTDHRSDLYSFGIILFEMLTGEAPFSGCGTMEMMYQRLHEKPRDIRSLNAAVPVSIAAIVSRCLERDPDRRYSSASEILADLENGGAKAAPWRLRMPVSGRLAVIGLAVLLAIVTGILAMTGKLPFRITGAAPTAPKGLYLAVLPFRPLANADTLKYQADGIAEGLSAKLFHLQNLHLSSPSAVERAKNQDSLQKIGRALGVTLLVHGTLQSSADKITANVYLEDISKGKVLWSDQISEVAEDVLALQDDVYVRLVKALNVSQSSEEVARASAHPTDNIEAYDLYLRGRALVRQKRDSNTVGFAMKYFETAVHLDGHFALAYAGLADSCMYMYDLTKDDMWSEKALKAATEATRWKNELPEAHVALGSAYKVSGRTNDAIPEFQRALQLSPNSDEACRRLASTYMAVGNKTEAIVNFKKAIDANPNYWENHNQLGAAYLKLGDYGKALASFQKVAELAPDLPAGFLNSGVIHFHQGEYQKAIPLFQKAVALRPTSSAYSNLAAAYYNTGQYREAAQAGEKAVELDPNNDLPVGNLADAYRLSGDTGKAKAGYEKAIALANKTLTTNPRETAVMARLALYYAKNQNPQRALEDIQRARKIDAADVELIFTASVIASLNNDQPAALRDLRTALEKGYSAKQIESEPDLKALRTTPGYRELMRRFAAGAKR